MKRKFQTAKVGAWMIAAIVAQTGLLCAFGEGVSTTVVTTGEKDGSTLLDTYARDEKGNISLLGNKATQQEKTVDPDLEIIKSLKDDTVFVTIAGRDKLTWGALHNKVDSILETRLGMVIGSAAVDQMGEVRLGMYKQSISKLLQRYIKTSVIANLAREEGIVVSDEEMASKIKDAMVRGKVKELDPYEAQYLTNAVYQLEYIEKRLMPTIEVKEEDIAALIAHRHEVNLSVPATNQLFKAQIEDIRAKIVAKEIAFGDAADEYSECVQCSSDNGDCGTWEEDDDSIDPALRSVCFSLPLDTVSEVIDTPEAYHIVMITSRYTPTDEAREDDGEVSTADVKHIQIDKWTEDPEFTHDTAKEFIEQKMLARALKKKQLELISKTKIDCVIPLEEKAKRGAAGILK